LKGEFCSTYLFLLFLDFLGVGCAEEEGTSFRAESCPEGEGTAERFRMPVITRMFRADAVSMLAFQTLKLALRSFRPLL
jgi:hypothetical protein